MVVPLPVGSTPDILARIASQKLAESWRSPVVVENRDGASGAIAVNQVVRAARDGYTLLFTNDFPIVINPALSKTSYDSRKDLAPLGAVAQNASVLVVHASTGIRSIKELVAAAKTKPGALTFASSGGASTSRMCVELIKHAAGIDLMHVPYKGAVSAIQAVLAGDVSMYCSPVFQALPHIKSGKLRALGVTSPKTPATMPEVAPISEQGLPDVFVVTWYALFANSGTPPEIRAKIGDALKRAFNDAGVREKLAGAGLDPIWLDPAGVAARVDTELETWTRLVTNLGITVQ